MQGSHVCTSKKRTRRSAVETHSREDFGRKHMARIQLWPTAIVFCNCIVVALQRRMVPSLEAVKYDPPACSMRMQSAGSLCKQSGSIFTPIGSGR
mmetsp:Transcript_26214/g.64734  ORF Transcript_26214/g.64734 Transcript_26214/m.64734 type:complete len:95 (-) Transcript_26214:326-610(-)